MAPSSIAAERGQTPIHKRPGIAPIIKIVHVHAPRLVCTDVANFRALVQEMTGNVSSPNNNCSPDIDTPKSSTYSQSEVSDHRAKHANGTAAPVLCMPPQRRSRRGTARCSMKARTNSHPANSSSARVQGAKGEEHSRGNGHNEDEEGDDECESPTTSWESTCDQSGRGALQGYTSRSSSVDGFFADHEHSDEDDDGGDGDHEGQLSDRCAYLNCSAYLPLLWRSAAVRDQIPGGFEYFSF